MHKSKQKNKMRDITNEIFPSFHLKGLPWTEKQKEVIRASQDLRAKIILIKAPAGVGKTALAVYLSLLNLSKGRTRGIKYIRVPIEAGGKGIGFLPSGANEKMAPYFGPAIDHFLEFLGKPTFEYMQKEETISITPLGFIQGLTFGGKNPGEGVSIICDEAADLTIKDLKLLTCRLGEGGSQMFIIGDVDQSNIKNSGFQKVFETFSTEEAENHGVYTFEFTSDDCMRSGITKYLVKTFENLQ